MGGGDTRNGQEDGELDETDHADPEHLADEKLTGCDGRQENLHDPALLLLDDPLSHGHAVSEKLHEHEDADDERNYGGHHIHLRGVGGNLFQARGCCSDVLLQLRHINALVGQCLGLGDVRQGSGDLGQDRLVGVGAVVDDRGCSVDGHSDSGVAVSDGGTRGLRGLLLLHVDPIERGGVDGGGDVLTHHSDGGGLVAGGKHLEKLRNVGERHEDEHGGECRDQEGLRPDPGTDLALCDE